jgi:hypothetical protein
MRQAQLSKLKQALPHIVGFYACAALLTGTWVYNRLPESRYDYDRRMWAAVNAGILWPLTMTARVLLTVRA